MNYLFQMTWVIVVFFSLLLISLQTLAKTARCTGSETVLVAVIDTGIDLEYSELKEWIWTNPGETGLDSFGRDKATNGIDDDGNGFVDDLHGWNFVQNNADVQDHHGHGTHVSGLITKYWPSETKQSACPSFQLMIIKYFDQRSPANDTLESSIKSYKYALDQGARIINFSGGGAKRSKAEEEILGLALAKKVLVVAAAGNEGVNTATHPFFPASYKMPNVLPIAALDKNQKLLATSNYGAAIPLATLGESLRSALPGNQHGFMTGTSQATAVTTGVAALILKHKPWLDDPRDVIAHLTSTSDKEIYSLFRRGQLGRLNVLKSLRSQDHFVSVRGRLVKNMNFISERMFLDSRFIDSKFILP